MPEVPTGIEIVSEPPGPEVLGKTFESLLILLEKLSCPYASINGHKKKTECCGSVILRVIRMLGDTWRKCIGWERSQWYD